MNLYQLTAFQEHLLNRLNGLDLDPQAIADTLEAEGVDEQIDAKLEAYVIVSREFDFRFTVRRAEAERQHAEAERLMALAEKDKKKVEALLKAVKTTMETLGKLDVQTPFFHLKIAKNPPKCDVFGDVPAEFMVQKPAPPPSVSLSAIKDAIKGGVDCSAFAKMVQESKIKIS